MREHCAVAQESSRHSRVVQLCLHMLQKLVQANNACSAWPVMDLASRGKCSTWKHNLPHRFYQCRLFALQYNPQSDHIRHVHMINLWYCCSVAEPCTPLTVHFWNVATQRRAITLLRFRKLVVLQHKHYLEECAAYVLANTVTMFCVVPSSSH